jgi:hypothetical protein
MTFSKGVLEKCQTLIDEIGSQFRTHAAITSEGLSELYRSEPAFQRIPKGVIDPRATTTWTWILFNNQARTKLDNVREIATRIILINAKFELIDTPEIVTNDDDWPLWLGEVNARLMRRAGRQDLRYIDGEDQILAKIKEVATGGMKSTKLTIYNTVFTRGHPEFSLSPEFITKFEQVKSELLNGYCDWRDIVLSADEDAYFRTANNSKSDNSTLEHVLLDLDLPLFQALAFKRSNRVVAAFVGWMFLGARQLRVYFSDDKETAEFFYDYLSELYKKTQAMNEKAKNNEPRASPKERVNKPSKTRLRKKIRKRT